METQQVDIPADEEIDCSILDTPAPAPAKQWRKIVDMSVEERNDWIKKIEAGQAGDVPYAVKYFKKGGSRLINKTTADKAATAPPKAPKAAAAQPVPVQPPQPTLDSQFLFTTILDLARQNAEQKMMNEKFLKKIKKQKKRLNEAIVEDDDIEEPEPAPVQPVQPAPAPTQPVQQAPRPVHPAPIQSSQPATWRQKLDQMGH